MGLDELGRQLSERDWAVLDLVGSHRFLTTRQLQAFAFAHHHTSSESAGRVCRRVLLRLEEWGLLQRPVRRIGGLEAGSAASIWMLTTAGVRLRNLRAGLGAVGRIREPGEGFVRHYLAIADTHLALIQAERSERLELVAVQIEPAAWRSYTGPTGNPVVLKPDLYTVTASGEFEDHWFIEVDRATESIPTLIRQCRQYEAYRHNGTEQADRGLFPLVLWVVPDELRAAKLRLALAAARELDSTLFRITTPERLIEAVTEGQQ
ncbi:MAG: replication-relaxation family protein [Actinobacteria bacterium]|nr:replication-relaxation family protein [Actinomycetota bacterium]